MSDEKMVDEAWKAFLDLAGRLPPDVQAQAGHLARLLVDAEVAAASERARTRMFPVLDARGGCPTRVPWAFAAPHEGWALENHGQSLEHLAGRGGLAAGELVAAVEGRNLRSMRGRTEAQDVERLRELLLAWECDQAKILAARDGALAHAHGMGQEDGLRAAIRILREGSEPEAGVPASSLVAEVERVRDRVAELTRRTDEAERRLADAARSLRKPSEGLRELLAWLDDKEAEYDLVTEHEIGAPVEGRHGRAARLLRFFQAQWSVRGVQLADLREAAEVVIREAEEGPVSIEATERLRHASAIAGIPARGTWAKRAGYRVDESPARALDRVWAEGGACLVSSVEETRRDARLPGDREICVVLIAENVEG